MPGSAPSGGRPGSAAGRTPEGARAAAASRAGGPAASCAGRRGRPVAGPYRVAVTKTTPGSGRVRRAAASQGVPGCPRSGADV